MSAEARLYVLLRRAYGGALRRSPTGVAKALRTAVGRWRHLLPRVASVPLPARPRVTVPGPRDTPVVLVQLLGCPPARVAEAVVAVREWPVRPVFVTDSDALDAFTTPAVLYEYLPAEADWARLAADAAPGGYASFVTQRLDAIAAAYEATSRVVADADGELAQPPASARRGGVILVATTVHPPDDPRIRQRTVGVLATRHRVRYATVPPGPTTVGGFEWAPLPGGRRRRALAVLRLGLRRDVRLVSLHDPGLLPVALLLRLLRRVPVVFDLHEDLPAQILMRDSLPGPLQKLSARAAERVLRLVEGALTFTLAEPDYARIFQGETPVLPNLPLAGSLAQPAPDEGFLVYVGDVTAARGAFVAVRATALLGDGRRLVLVGRCRAALQARLRALADELGVELELRGYVEHAEALRLAAGATAAVCPLLDLPNYRRSMPTKVVEYLGSGLPVVASDLPGTRAQIGGFDAVKLVAPGDPHAVADALRELCRPAVRAAAAAQAATVRARMTFDPELALGVYERLLARR